MNWPFSLEIKVRFRDLDAMGHVNNAVYFTYLELARTEYYIKLTNIKKLSDLDFIVVSASCDYKSAASIEDKIVAYIKPTRVGTSSWTFKYELREKDSGRLIVEAETVQVAFDYKKRKKKAINDVLKQKLLSEIQ